MHNYLSALKVFEIFISFLIKPSGQVINILNLAL